MPMRSLYSYIVVACFLLVSASPMVMVYDFDEHPVSRVGPKADAVDFKVLDIELGNSSRVPMQWEQPNSSFQEYLESHYSCEALYKQAGPALLNIRSRIE